MPKVKSYSAAWLAKNAPGHQLFERHAETARSYTSNNLTLGPRRTIAKRGTEVFVAVGKELRWGDLVYLKEQWRSKQVKNQDAYGIKHEDSIESSIDYSSASGMRTLKTRCAEDIRQLIISPNGNYLAILTTHTVHICILPASSHLTSDDTEPLKPKMFTLGPTTHVTSRSPVMSATWHPLGVNGSCLVTVTADAIVRLWELDPANRWSFDKPTTSIDLKRLANGTSLDQDFSASAQVTNKGFSPDSFEMEVAAANFGNRGSGGWDSMTLWVAMREGHVYALCPLLPQKWAPPPTLIPSLSVSIVTTVASMEDDPDVTECDKLLAQQQLEWMGELDSQDPCIVEGPAAELIEVYNRPSRPGIVPRLQGPLELDFDPDTGDELDTYITDIMVIGRKSQTEDLMLGEDYDLEIDECGEEGASISLLCLMSTSGQVRVYLNLDGIQAQWLPPKNKSRLSRLLADAEPPSLLAFQAIDTMLPVEVNEDSWPVFSEDVMSRYSFFVTHHAGIVFISLAPWIFRLDQELQGESEAGSDFRVGMVVNSQSGREKMWSPSTADANVALAGAVSIQDPDLGYFLLSATPYESISLTFEQEEVDIAPEKPGSPELESLEEMVEKPLDFYEPRPVWQPSHAFDQSSALTSLLQQLRTSRHKTVVNQEVRLSPLTLGIFTDAHKLLSDETYRLGVAAAEVFRRCEILQTELRQQVLRANEVKGKIDSINGEGREDDEVDNVKYQRRIEHAQNRHSTLMQRVENLRKVVTKATARDLSAKERAFFEEVQSIECNISPPTPDSSESPAQVHGKPLWERLEEAKYLQGELTHEVEALTKAGSLERSTNGREEREMRIPVDVRKNKMQMVEQLLERETALVEAVKARLERLKMSP